MSDDIPSRVGDEIRARLTGLEGLPTEIWRNRGRLGVWKDVAAGNVAGQFAVVNVMDGDPINIEELVTHDAEEMEVEQACLIDLVVYDGEDDRRRSFQNKALAAIVDAITPRDKFTGRRDHTLGGLVDWIELLKVEREGLVLDTSPGVAGATISFKFLFTADTVLGAPPQTGAWSLAFNDKDNSMYAGQVI